jgi:transglutaminase-like putative cysteine protease
MTGQVRVTFFAGLATLLTSLAFTPVFTVQTWFWPVLAALVLIGGTGALLRRRSAPAALVILAQVAVTALWITWQYAPHAFLGLVPGPGAFRDFSRLASAGATDAQDYGTPVPPTKGLEFLTVLGTCTVGLMVDALAVTFRRAALAGLPLLALYTVPASVVNGGLNWLLFVLAAVGYIALLIAEGRDKLSRWGRPLIPSSDPGRAGRGTVAEVQTAPFAAVGRRIGAAVIGLAIVVPAAFPLADDALTKGAGGLFGNDGKGSGDRKVTTLNPLTSLRNNFFQPKNVPIMTMKTDTTDGSNLYLRAATLDKFDGTDWTRSDTAVDRLDQLPRPAGLTEKIRQEAIHTEITTTKNIESSFLPVPYPLTDINISEGSWRVDVNTQNILSWRSSRQIQDKNYKTTSLAIAPTAEQLANAAGSPGPEFAKYISLPNGLPGTVKELAQQHTEGAQTPYDKALRLQDWLRNSGEFHYDISPSIQRRGTGLTAIEQFLQDKRGYCEQFASMMAVMARSLGIPARVDVGFTAGQRQPDGKTYVVSSHDAHAWPELYFDTIGWVRFEPTPFGEGGQGTATVPAYATAPNQKAATGATNGNNGGSTEPTQSASPGGAGSTPTSTSTAQQCKGLAGQALAACQRDLGTSNTGGGVVGRDIPLWMVILIALALVLLVAPSLLRIGIRRRRYRRARSDQVATANAAWDELRDSARDLGYSWTASETPRQAAARLARKGKLRHNHTEALARLTTAVEQARYAPRTGDTSTVIADVRAVRAGLARRVGRGQQVRSVVLPASTVVVLHWLGERIADLLDAIDRSGAAAKRRLLSVFRRTRAAPGN